MREVVKTGEDPENSENQEKFGKQNLNDLLVRTAEDRWMLCLPTPRWHLYQKQICHPQFFPE